MADDLIRRHLQKGMTSDEVVKLIGRPETTLKGETDGGANRLVGNHTYSYWIGSWTFAAWDSTFVYVYFDDNERVISAEMQGF